MSKGLLHPKAAGTAKVVNFFDKLFDCVNSLGFLEKKMYRRPICRENASFQFLRSASSFLGDLKFVNSVGKDVGKTIYCRGMAADYFCHPRSIRRFDEAWV